MLLSIAQIEDEAKLADTLVAHLSNLKLQDKQKLLEETSSRKRLEELYGYIQSEIEIMRVEKKIRARVKRQMEKTQKEYYLNEQMAAIQKELGDREDGRAELQELDDQIKEKKLSTEARDKLTKELKKLKLMSPMSAEATVVRNYIDTVLSLPWGEYTGEIRDIAFAEDRSFVLLVLPVSEKPHLHAVWPMPPAESLFASPLAVFVIKLKFVDIARLILGRCLGKLLPR